MKKRELYYITYQVFPSPKANNLQTIRMVDALNSLFFKVNLIFPDRQINLDTDDIYSFYNIQTKLNIIKLKHFLPFDKVKQFKKINFIFSSFIWSFYAVMKILKTSAPDAVYMTRTNFVLLFLLLKNKTVIYDCHKFSKIDNLIFKLFSRKNNVLIVFSTQTLRDSFKLTSNLLKNSISIHSSFEANNFPKNISKIEKRVVFVGQLLRFEKTRNIDFLIKCFKDSRLKEFELVIVGGPDIEIKKLQSSGIPSNVFLKGQLTNTASLEEICKGEIGILINDETSHSMHYTSPIKYFEYLKAKNKIVAVNFASHLNLPMNENNFYFEHNNIDSFVENILRASKKSFIFNPEINNYSYESRARTIYQQLARLEGLEPPTL